MIPTIFKMAINENIVSIKGKNLLPSSPIDSKTVEKIKLYTNSKIDCQRFGMMWPSALLFCQRNQNKAQAIKKKSVAFVTEKSNPPIENGINLINSNWSKALYINIT
jgi:hypothetical protein